MIKAVFPTVLPAIYQFGMNMTLEPLDFLDDGTSAQIAKLLGGGVLKVIARSVWMNDDPKTVTMTVGVPTELHRFRGSAGSAIWRHDDPQRRGSRLRRSAWLLLHAARTGGRGGAGGDDPRLHDV